MEKIILSIGLIGAMSPAVICIVTCSPKKDAFTTEKDEIANLIQKHDFVKSIKTSNIKKGEMGSIFQDNQNNLWAMSDSTKLQVLQWDKKTNNYVDTGWTEEGLAKGSAIKDGHNGLIFQDQQKNLWSIGYESKLQVLKWDKKTNNYVTTGWTEEGLASGSKTSNGYEKSIFQDQQGNLWMMRSNAKLQVLKWDKTKDNYVTTGWTEEGLASGSNINKIGEGKIFQDKANNLWIMGKGANLQVLKWDLAKNNYVTTGWTEEGLASGSNIKNSPEVTIFQDRSKNLWIIGNKSKLQVLKWDKTKSDYVTTGWTEEGLASGSASNDGNKGTILFQDQQGNLWMMRSGAKLQVLKWNKTKSDYVTSGWTEEGLASGSAIKDGHNGLIFQDQQNNLWSVSYKNKLQVLKWDKTKSNYVTTGWTEEGLASGSNIKNGWKGIIFQDRAKNLWTIGNKSKLQVLKWDKTKDNYVTTGWTEEGLASGSNIKDGEEGTIFQDKRGNLWTMGKETKLQVLPLKTFKWINQKQEK